MRDLTGEDHLESIHQVASCRLVRFKRFSVGVNGKFPPSRNPGFDSLFGDKNRCLWFSWVIPCSRAIYFSKRPPMAASFTGFDTNRLRLTVETAVMLVVMVASDEARDYFVCGSRSDLCEVDIGLG